MTPLEYAEAIRKLAEESLIAATRPVPAQTWSQLGDVVLACEALVASAVDTTARDEGGQQCDFSQIATVQVALSRECSDVANEDGTTDIVAQQAVSLQQDQDGQALWELAQSLPLYLEKTWSISYTITGGLSITTLSLTAGVP